MIAAAPRDSAAAPPPRLVLAPKRLSRAVLDGAWWPRSGDASAELTALVQALTERYGRIRYVILNGASWEGHIRRLPVAGNLCRVGWFTSMNAALLVATTDGGDQLDLLLVPPSASETVAEHAMTDAADPSNMEHAADLLARSERTAITRPVAVAAGVDDAPEAVWDNEGGAGGQATRSEFSHQLQSLASAERPT